MGIYIMKFNITQNLEPSAFSDETLVNIFMFLNFKELMGIALTCKHFHKLITEDKLLNLQLCKSSVEISKSDMEKFMKLTGAALHKIAINIHTIKKEVETQPNWFGNLSKEDADKILSEGRYIAGTILLRESSSLGFFCYSHVHKNTSTSAPLGKPISNIQKTTNDITNHITYVPAENNAHLQTSASEEDWKQGKLTIFHGRFTIQTLFENVDTVNCLVAHQRANNIYIKYSSLKEFLDILGGNPLNNKKIPEVPTSADNNPPRFIP